MQFPAWFNLVSMNVEYCEALKDLGLLCKETHVNTIRFSPPLIISRDQVDWALERIESVLTDSRPQMQPAVNRLMLFLGKLRVAVLD